MAGSRPARPLSDAATALYADGSHCFSCQGHGEGGAKGRKNAHHTHVLHALDSIFKKFGGISDPSSLMLPRVAGARRGDILFTREANGVPVLFDLVITTPTSMANLASMASVQLVLVLDLVEGAGAIRTRIGSAADSLSRSPEAASPTFSERNRVSLCYQ